MMSLNIKRPMLAVDAGDLTKIKYPCYISPKIDGIRCLKVNGKALSRKFKPIPNNYVRNWIESNLPDGVDGELVVWGKSFNEIQSLIMTETGEPNFTFLVFDYVSSSLDEPYRLRYLNLLFFNQVLNHFQIMPTQSVNSVEELLTYNQKYIDAGYEGMMIRSIDGPYKEGRSTLKEGYLLKVKQWQDAEGVVIGFEEQMHNDNNKEINELGLSKRSSKKEGKVPANTLGAFVIKTLHDNVELRVSTGIGLTKELRQEIWDNKDKYLGKILTFKYQPHGTKNAPRIPIWKGFRHEDDI